MADVNIYNVIKHPEKFAEENKLAEDIRNYDPTKDPHKKYWGELMDRVYKIRNYNRADSLLWLRINKVANEIEAGLPITVEKGVEQLLLFP